MLEKFSPSPLDVLLLLQFPLELCQRPPLFRVSSPISLGKPLKGTVSVVTLWTTPVPQFLSGFEPVSCRRYGRLGTLPVPVDVRVSDSLWFVSNVSLPAPSYSVIRKDCLRPFGLFRNFTPTQYPKSDRLFKTFALAFSFPRVTPVGVGCRTVHCVGLCTSVWV